MSPAGVLAEVEAIGERVEAVASVDRAPWSARSHSDVLPALIGLQERVSALVLEATAEWDRRHAWKLDGALSPVPWLKRKTGLAERDARCAVRSARLVARNADLAKLLAAGDMTAGHVDAMAVHVTPPRADSFDRDADVLLDAARNLSVDETAAVMRRWAAYVDDELNRGEPDDLHGRRGVWFRRTGDIEELRALGNPAELAVLRLLLDQMERPDRKDTPGGPRSLAQRRYDALIALAERGPSTHRDPAHTVNIVIDDTTLVGGFDPDGRSEIAGHGSVLPAAVQRLLCGSWISRVVMGTAGQVLDLGREARLFSPAQQQAILVRDGGCAIGLCDRPPEWADVHHLDPYGPPTNGRTDLENGIGACRPHHVLMHHGWKPVQDEDGRWHLQPP
jgi:hypothetical protein